MYPIHVYGDLIADRVRLDAYRKALQLVVRPGCAVLDLGAGTGIFSLLSCQLGAARVYAVEAADVVQLARETVKANGLEDRVTVIRATSREIELPCRVDVIVSDLRDVLPLYRAHLSSVDDARRRFLAPGGALIPRLDTLWVAPVESSRIYERIDTPWEGSQLGFDLRPAAKIAKNLWIKCSLEPSELIAEALCWSVCDYQDLKSTDVSGTARWLLDRSATVHGIGVWFQADLAEGVGFSSGPAGGCRVYGQAFFPWKRPLQVDRGDVLRVELKARLVGDDYQWWWSCQVCRPPDEASPSLEEHHSTLHGLILDPDHLRRREEQAVPVLGRRGRRDRLLLRLMDGQHSLIEVASKALAEVPEDFSGIEDALERARTLAQKYTG